MDVCPDCNGQWKYDGGGTLRTCVGYVSPAGHDHDDNCRTRKYTCVNGHSHILSAVNRCGACDWEGKKSCFCHQGPKVKDWPVYKEA